MNALILGIGNEILSDDAVGIRLARRIAETFQNPGWEVAWGEFGPLETMERLVGRDAAILIDSVRAPGLPPGRVSSFPLDRLRPTEHLAWSHGIDLLTALHLGRQHGRLLPERVFIIAVSIRDNTTLSESMTPELERRFDAIAAEVRRAIDGIIRSLPPPG